MARIAKRKRTAKRKVSTIKNNWMVQNAAGSNDWATIFYENRNPKAKYKAKQIDWFKSGVVVKYWKRSGSGVDRFNIKPNKDMVSKIKQLVRSNKR